MATALQDQTIVARSASVPKDAVNKKINVSPFTSLIAGGVAGAVEATITVCIATSRSCYGSNSVQRSTPLSLPKPEPSYIKQ